jgi:hypothetical protein
MPPINPGWGGHADAVAAVAAGLGASAAPSLAFLAAGAPLHERQAVKAASLDLWRRAAAAAAAGGSGGGGGRQRRRRRAAAGAGGRRATRRSPCLPGAGLLHDGLLIGERSKLCFEQSAQGVLRVRHGGPGRGPALCACMMLLVARSVTNLIGRGGEQSLPFGKGIRRIAARHQVTDMPRKLVTKMQATALLWVEKSLHCVKLEFRAAPHQRPPLLTARHLHIPVGGMDSIAGIARLGVTTGGR